MIEAFLAGGLSLVGGWAGAYLGAYLKKKGENRAIHEDISKLVDQVRVVTQTTKEIEAKISDEVWDRQKRWELKREALFELIRTMARVDDALVSLHALTQVEKKEEDINWVRSRHDVTTKWNGAYAAFEEAVLLATTVCGNTATAAFHSYSAVLTKVAQRLAKDIDGEIYRATHMERMAKQFVVRAVIREELGIDETPVESQALSKAAV